ncbi:MAG: FkbM family methyltransferase [Bacteroidetes bacterium]|nr:FkbM family methyltransferase [Bacteroidota bacterium]
MKKLLKSLPFPKSEKITLIDIGARWGVNPPWDGVDSEFIIYYGFEPDKEECALLNKNTTKNITYFPIAISDIEGESSLYLTNEPGCSSILCPNNEFLSKFYLSERWEVEKQIKIQTIPLKKILVTNNILPDIVKIDVQGLAFQVLIGMGNEFISDSLFFEIEVEYNEMYKGEHFFPEIYNLMYENGFVLIDVCNYYAKQKNLPISNSTRGQIMFADTFFIISIDHFYNKKLEDQIKHTKIWKIVLILCAYGQFDLALEFALHPDSNLSSEEKKTIKDCIYKYTKLGSIRVFLFNNVFFEKLGYLISLTGNFFQIKSRLFGWFSDNNSITTRYKKRFKFLLFNTIFRK